MALCRECGKEFRRIRANHYFCSKSCRVAAEQKDMRSNDGLKEFRQQEGLPPIPEPGEAICLNCDEVFISANPTSIRTCDRCKAWDLAGVVDPCRYGYLAPQERKGVLPAGPYPVKVIFPSDL